MAADEVAANGDPVVDGDFDEAVDGDADDDIKFSL